MINLNVEEISLILKLINRRIARLGSDLKSSEAGEAGYSPEKVRKRKKVLTELRDKLIRGTTVRLGNTDD